jgi:hypothetical protein
MLFHAMMTASRMNGPACERRFGSRDVRSAATDALTRPATLVVSSEVFSCDLNHKWQRLPLIAS